MAFALAAARLEIPLPGLVPGSFCGFSQSKNPRFNVQRGSDCKACLARSAFAPGGKRIDGTIGLG